jgi:tRNA 2-thiouridine synthesizing protein A
LSININKTRVNRLDIQGEVCPMTFVYTKLALEEIKKGDILEVKLDFPSALKNIPDSCKRQNLAEVINIKKLKSDKKTWVLILKKL